MAGKKGKEAAGLPAATELARSDENSRIVGQMLSAFIRGREEGDKKVRAAKLVENLWELAMRSENDSIRLAATKEILDRVDGKVVERKELRSLKIEGVVYLPSANESAVKEAVICG